MAQKVEDSVTSFLTTFAVAEGVLKTVAPEIDTALDASREYITENTLDIAKAVNLSGAFISGSLCAFPSALQLARTLMSVIGEDEDKSVLETIEWLDNQAGPHMQQAKRMLQNLDVILETGKQLEQETHERVSNAAVSAYRDLEEAVESVLKIEPGSAPIRRGDLSVITKPDWAVMSFENLSRVSSTSAWELGENSAALMSFSDTSKAFKGTLEGARQKLKMQLKNNNAARQRHNDNMATLKRSEDAYINRRAVARAELATPSNQFLSFSGSSVGEDQELIVSDANAALDKNWQQQKAVTTKVQALDTHDAVIGWTMRALDVAKASAERVAQEFQAKFKFIMHAQQRSYKVAAVLLRLANAIRDTKPHITRDNWLRLVLFVLEGYHNIRHDYDALEIPGIEERRIHRAIVDRLGRDAVMKLVEPPAPGDMMWMTI